MGNMRKSDSSIVRSFGPSFYVVDGKAAMVCAKHFAGPRLAYRRRRLMAWRREAMMRYVRDACRSFDYGPGRLVVGCLSLGQEKSIEYYYTRQKGMMLIVNVSYCSADLLTTATSDRAVALAHVGSRPVPVALESMDLTCSLHSISQTFIHQIDLFREAEHAEAAFRKPRPNFSRSTTRHCSTDSRLAGSHTLDYGLRRFSVFVGAGEQVEPHRLACRLRQKID